MNKSCRETFKKETEKGKLCIEYVEWLENKLEARQKEIDALVEAIEAEMHFFDRLAMDSQAWCGMRDRIVKAANDAKYREEKTNESG